MLLFRRALLQFLFNYIAGLLKAFYDIDRLDRIDDALAFLFLQIFFQYPQFLDELGMQLTQSLAFVNAVLQRAHLLLHLPNERQKAFHLAMPC
jgi:hypothetical protein